MRRIRLRLAGGCDEVGGPNIGRSGEVSVGGLGGASMLIRVATVQQLSLKTG
jgi:hypothetical protein